MSTKKRKQGKRKSRWLPRLPPTVNAKQVVIGLLPYILIAWVGDKLGWLYHYCPGSNLFSRLVVLLSNAQMAFGQPFISFHPRDLLVGVAIAAAVRLVVAYRASNSRKFRHGREYGSARWGTPKDIAPFIDPVYENNIILTATERLTMNGRPSLPKYARNKNVIVIGGSGSGKTRFFVKPNLMQMPEKVSFVVTDPKGSLIIECGRMLVRGGYRVKVLNTINFAKSIRNKLEAMGVPREEIAFIHEATTETQKAELFAKVRAGQVRVLLGSTAKLGAGTNMQDRLIALHHLDAPWKPSDLEQQEGRILRQGNMNEKVQIFRYVTEGTFDAYMWQILENKQKFISQIMTSKSPVRACEDVDDTALSYAEIKALATGNPYIKEKMDLDIQVAKLRMLRASHTSQIYRLETDIARTYPVQIASVQQRIANLEADKAAAAPVLAMDKEQFEMKVSGVVYTDRKDAGNALIKACTAAKTVSQELPVGEYHGFRLSASYDTFTNNFELSVRGQGKYTIKLGADPFGNLTRINNVLEGFTDSLEESKRKLATLKQQLETAKEEVAKPFPQEQELIQKEARLSELNALLNMDERGSEAALIDEEAAVDEESQGRAAAEEQRGDAVEADEPEQDEVEQETVKPKRYQMAI